MLRDEQSQWRSEAGQTLSAFDPQGPFLSLSFIICGSDGKASACNAGDLGLMPGSGISPGEGNGNPFQYPCQENPMDGGAWWAAAHGVAESWTQPSDFTFTFKLNVFKVSPNLSFKTGEKQRICSAALFEV